MNISDQATWTGLDHIRETVVKTLVYADDVKIRWQMAIASIMWAVWIFADPEMFQRPYYHVMVEMMPTWLWALFFATHGVGAVWRILDRQERKGWALFINGLGVAVWVAATVCQNIGSMSHRFTASNILEFMACLFLIGSFTSTGFSSKSTTA